MKVLSIIIPAYNSECFLDKCVGSLLHEQVLPELDIIIVNDGSKDNTARVAQKYCDQYPESVRLINQENKGHGGALNTGCAAAVGKCLKVIDADDWVETQNLPEFVRLLKTCDSDVVLTHHHTVDISNGEIKNWKSYPEVFGKGYSFDEITASWGSFERSLTLHGITYNTAFYQKHGYRLSEYVFYEDYEYASFPCCYASSVTPFDLFLYDYRIGDVNQSVSDSNQLKRIGHTETVLKRMLMEHSKLTCSKGGKSYVAMKAQGLLLSYLTTVLLLEVDKKKGRKQAEHMMSIFKDALPEAYTIAEKKYRVFSLMNRLGMTKKTWEAILHSKLYNTLRGKRDFV